MLSRWGQHPLNSFRYLEEPSSKSALLNGPGYLPRSQTGRTHMRISRSTVLYDLHSSYIRLPVSLSTSAHLGTRNTDMTTEQHVFRTEFTFCHSNTPPRITSRTARASIAQVCERMQEEIMKFPKFVWAK